jgi:geranylgeranyl reductase family protein
MLDVLVVGAGPAGAVAALVLARAGAQVLMVDRARFPRRKLCGDTLNPGAVALLTRLGLASCLAEARRLDGMILTGEGGERIEARYPPPHGALALPRRDLDAALVARAVAEGARFDEAVLVRRPLVAERKGQGCSVSGVEAVVSGRPVRLEARVIIAADGRRSTLAFALGLATQPTRPRRWAFGAYFEGVADLTTMGEMHVRRGRYIGLAPLPGGLANACLVVDPLAGPARAADRLWQALADDPWLAPRFARARLVGSALALGPLAVDAAAAGVPGLLLAGDAAGFVDPMTGDGMRFALRSGELAARAALRMLATGRQDGHRVLAQWRAREFGAKIRVNRLLRRATGSAVGLAAGRLVARTMPAALRALVVWAGDVPRAVDA